MNVLCYSCQTENIVVDKVGFRDSCIKCYADLHVCKTCHFYDEKVYNECGEPAADRVKDKEKSNFCEFYQTVSTSPQGKKTLSKEDLRAQAEALFSGLGKKKET